MMRLAIVALLTASGVYAFSAAADDAETIAEIRAAVVELDQAYPVQDVSTIERMTTPNAVSIAPRYGGAASLDQQVETFGQLERKHSDYSPIEVELLSPDIALVTFEKSYTGTYKGATLPPRVFVSEIWMKRGDTWLNRFYQETPIEEP